MATPEWEQPKEEERKKLLLKHDFAINQLNHLFNFIIMYFKYHIVDQFILPIRIPSIALTVMMHHKQYFKSIQLKFSI